MKVYTSYFARQRSKKYSDKTIISVANSTPEWFAPYCIKASKLAPEWEYLSLYKNKEISFESFKQRYLQTLLDRFGDEARILEYVTKLANNKDVLLLCWEKDFNSCHRSILAELLKSHYISEL